MKKKLYFVEFIANKSNKIKIKKTFDAIDYINLSWKEHKAYF